MNAKRTDPAAAEPWIAPHDAEYDDLFSPEACAFLVALHRRFAEEIDARLAANRDRQRHFDEGWLPGFLDDTRWIREGDWRVEPPPSDLVDRRVEITGPTDRAMVVNALNSGAKVFMADFEDAHAPTWAATLAGQVNLMDAIRRRIDFTSEQGKEYRLGEETATLIARPRGLHLTERHFQVGGRRIAGALFDAGLYLFHNARELLDRGSGPYLYLPKLENHREARLWNEICELAEHHLELPHGSIRVTVLIETLPSAFEMDEILYELRERICGLNCGRWDYIFSFIKTFRAHPDYVLPDRGQVTMTRHFLRSYSKLLIRTCHHRGTHAMGGMAAQVPVRDDPEANEAAMAKVRADKEREAGDGHDGTWVAHPGLVPVAAEVFDQLMPEANQVARQYPEYEVHAPDLLRVPDGTITEAGLRDDVSAAVRYLGSWLSGRGCVPIRHLMEDAATAEIARAQLWQWVHHEPGVLDDGRRVTPELVRAVLEDERAELRGELGESGYAGGRWDEAIALVDELATAEQMADFLTLGAYERLE